MTERDALVDHGEEQPNSNLEKGLSHICAKLSGQPLQTMTKLVRGLIASHLVIFAAGFYVGKKIDEDELSLYRGSHESWPTRLKRQASTVGVGVVALGTLVIVMRAVSRSGASRVEI